MAQYKNLGRVDVEKARASILAAGGGENTRKNSDGSIHHSIYSTKENRHLSYDEYSDGSIKNIHSDKDNRPFWDYK